MLDIDSGKESLYRTPMLLQGARNNKLHSTECLVAIGLTGITQFSRAPLSSWQLQYRTVTGPDCSQQLRAA